VSAPVLVSGFIPSTFICLKAKDEQQAFVSPRALAFLWKFTSRQSILILGTGWNWMVRVELRSLCLEGKGRRYPLKRRLVGPQGGCLWPVVTEAFPLILTSRCLLFVWMSYTSLFFVHLIINGLLLLLLLLVLLLLLLLLLLRLSRVAWICAAVRTESHTSDIL
jgi:hypothetical protein